MSITLNGSVGITSPLFDGPLDASDLTGNVAAARITTALNATGSAPIYACRAWVNFNGTGTVAIRASGNVSSITDNGTGDYTVNFTTAMPDANYSVVGGCQNISGQFSSVTWQPHSSAGTGVVTPVVGSTRGVVAVAQIGNVDCANISVAIFR
jgi:hypothetical protein